MCIFQKEKGVLECQEKYGWMMLKTKLRKLVLEAREKWLGI